MSRGDHPFRQSDVVRAIKAARAAGEESFRVEISDGKNKIMIVIGAKDTPGTVPTEDEDFQRWVKSHTGG